MFICTECNEKYQTKPEYCSCGNDEFKFVTEQVPSQSENLELPSKTTIYSYVTINRIKKLVPIVVFFSCLILSVAIWLINPKSEPTPKVVEKAVTSLEIPDFDEIWVDATPDIKEKVKAQPKQNMPVVNKVQEQINKIVKPNAVKTTTTNSQALQKPKSQVPVVKKPQTTSNPTPVQQKPVNPKTQDNKSQTQVKLPQSIVDTVKTPEKNQTNTQSVQTQQPATPEVVEVKPEPPKMNATEFLNYKGAIRSALLAKLNVMAVQGSGDCAIEFALDDYGKLINRNFIYKSTNKTVNDEVYNMMMRLPYYNKPPQHYNGEKIKLKFRFDNGYYEISFI